jgi:hypothetical protein
MSQAWTTGCTSQLALNLLVKGMGIDLGSRRHIIFSFAGTMLIFPHNYED